jgi:hypothetical protein
MRDENLKKTTKVSQIPTLSILLLHYMVLQLLSLSCFFVAEAFLAKNIGQKVVQYQNQI